MKILLKKNIVFISILMISSSLFAEPVSKLVSPEIYEELKQNGFLQKKYIGKDDFNLQLVPDVEYGKKAAEYWNSDNGTPVFIVENLYLKSKADLSNGNTSEVTLDKASSIVRSVSQMQGMKYYSNTRKKITVLYEEAYCVSDPENKTKHVLDQNEGSAEGIVEYCCLKDSSFGKTYYKLEYHQSDNEIFAGFSNFEPVYVGFIKAVEKDNLRTGFVYIDCGDDILVYIVTQAKYPSMKILENTVFDSFTARVNAVYDWFIDQY